MRLGVFVFAVVLVWICAGVERCLGEAWFGVRLELATELARPGDLFWVRGQVSNTGPEDLGDLPVFFVLEVHGEFWFWPSWSRYSPSGQGGVDWEVLPVPVGRTDVDVVPAFEWPDTGSEAVGGLHFYGAMLDPSMSFVIGEPAMVEWGYGPPRAPWLSSLAPGAGSPGDLLKVRGRGFDLGSGDHRVVVGDLRLPVVARGVAEEGYTEFVVASIPAVGPGDHAVSLEVGGRESSNTLEVTLEELPETGKPSGQVLGDVSAGVEALCGELSARVIPDAVALGMIPAAAEGDLVAAVERARSLFGAFSGALGELPEDQRDVLERLLVRNGLDEVFNGLSRAVPGRSGQRGEEDVAAFELCLSLDVTSACLTAINSAWTALDVTALLMASGGQGLGASAAGGAVGMHFAIMAVDALIDGFIPTDLEGISVEGEGERLSLPPEGRSDYTLLGAFRSQEIPVDVTFGALVDELPSLAALPEPVVEEVRGFIAWVLGDQGLSLLDGLLGDQVMGWGNPAPINVRLAFGVYDQSVHLEEWAARGMFGSGEALMELLRVLGMYPLDTGAEVGVPWQLDVGFEQELMRLTGRGPGATTLDLVASRFKPPLDGGGAFTSGLEIPRRVSGAFIVDLSRALSTPTPTPTRAPGATDTPLPTAPPSVTPVVTPTPPSSPDGFVFVPAGQFEMGSPPEELCRQWDEGPVHTVSVTQGFHIQRTEVTQAQWTAIFGVNPSHFERPDGPVERVTWYDALIYCNRLSLLEGLRPCYYRDEAFIELLEGEPPVLSGPVFWDRSADGYRLPTEAEWEYACRAGTETPYNNGRRNTGCYDDPQLDPLAWYLVNSGYETHEVGLKQPNVRGLYDMHGNVKEWCWDWYDHDYYESSPAADPAGPPRGSFRLARGGDCYSRSGFCRSAARDFAQPGFPSETTGFRPVRSAGPNAGAR
jgi:formylglycine-generating enzyme required for sulfatase activity